MTPDYCRIRWSYCRISQIYCRISKSPFLLLSFSLIRYVLSRKVPVLGQSILVKIRLATWISSTPKNSLHSRFVMVLLKIKNHSLRFRSWARWSVASQKGQYQVRGCFTIPILPQIPHLTPGLKSLNGIPYDSEMGFGIKGWWLWRSSVESQLNAS